MNNACLAAKMTEMRPAIIKLHEKDKSERDSGIVEASANQGLGRDYGGNSFEDRGPLPDAPQGLGRSRRWPFRIINSCFLFFSCYVMFLNKI